VPGAQVGIDFAGEVAKIGSKVDPKLDLHLGDTVVGSVHGGMYHLTSSLGNQPSPLLTNIGLYQDIGAFAEYAKVDSELVWKIPEGTLSIEEAVTLGAGLLTCVLVMWDPNRLALVEYPDTVEEDTWVSFSHVIDTDTQK
jgi:NADPH:quinone reductase-like Zn-dependent oxidoreductase